MDALVKRKNNPFFYIYLALAVISIGFSLFVGIEILISPEDETGFGKPFVFLFYLFTLVPFLISFIPFIIFKVKNKKGIYKEYKKTSSIVLAFKIVVNIALLVITLIYII